MSDKKFKLALCQLRTDFDVDTTMNKTEAMLREAAEHGAQAVCLPEMYCCQYRGAAFRMFAERGSEDIVEKMSRWAKEYGLLLVGGSIPEVADGRMYNTCYVFDRSGAQLAKYRKMHLFDSDLPELHSHESEIFGHGNSIEVFDTDRFTEAQPFTGKSMLADLTLDYEDAEKDGIWLTAHCYAANESYREEGEGVPEARREKGWRFQLATPKETAAIESVAMDGSAASSLTWRGLTAPASCSPGSEDHLQAASCG